MWNLNGDDVQRAKEELKGRRAAIQARYENELKQLEVDIVELETFERFAVKFVSDFKAEDAPQTAVAEPSPPVETAAAEAAGEQPSPASPDGPGEPSAEPETAASAEPTGGQRSSSRWRMRLNTGEAAP
jgi:hypothetical protein